MAKLVSCPYDPSHKVIAHRLPYHKVKCRRNFFGKSVQIEDTRTRSKFVPFDDFVPSSTGDYEEFVDGNSHSLSFLEIDDNVSSTESDTLDNFTSISERSYGSSAVTSVSFHSYSLDSLKFEKVKLEKERYNRNLPSVPRPNSPQHEKYNALCDAIAEKMVLCSNKCIYSCNDSSNISMGRGMPVQTSVTRCSPGDLSNRGKQSPYFQFNPVDPSSDETFPHLEENREQKLTSTTALDDDVAQQTLKLLVTRKKTARK